MRPVNDGQRLLPPLALAGGCAAAIVAGGRVAWSVASGGGSGLFNDFYDYWGAAVLLNRGHDPYDVAALAAVQHTAGLQVTAGGGYSYPVAFAEVLRPLALLPPHLAAGVFCAASVAALALAAGLLLASLPSSNAAVVLAGGAAAGLFPPVIGSLFFGQANLIVLLLLALAYRRVAPAAMLAAGAGIKLYPITGFVAFVRNRARLTWRPWVLGLAVVLAVVVPQLTVGGGFPTEARGMAAPDTYWSNVSVNGWLSRLSLPSDWTRPPLPGLPVTPLMLATVGALAVLTLIIVARTPDEPFEGRLALCLWLGVVAAPKNSLWNFTPLLLTVAFVWPRVAHRWRLLLVGVTGWLLLEAQAELGAARDSVYRGGPGFAWLSSVGLYGALMLGALNAYLLLRPRVARRAAAVPAAISEPATRAAAGRG